MTKVIAGARGGESLRRTHKHAEEGHKFTKQLYKQLFARMVCFSVRGFPLRSLVLVVQTLCARHHPNVEKRFSMLVSSSMTHAKHESDN